MLYFLLITAAANAESRLFSSRVKIKRQIIKLMCQKRIFRKPIVSKICLTFLRVLKIHNTKFCLNKSDNIVNIFTDTFYKPFFYFWNFETKRFGVILRSNFGDSSQVLKLYVPV